MIRQTSATGNWSEYRNCYGNLCYELQDGLYSYYGIINETSGVSNITETRTITIDTETHNITVISTNGIVKLELINSNLTFIHQSQNIQSINSSADTYEIYVNTTKAYFSLSYAENKIFTVNNGTYKTSIPRLSSVPSSVEIQQASFDQSADRGNGVVTIQSYGSSDYILGISMPNATCKYGFRNAKIKDADWDTCDFNLSVRGNRITTITSYYAPGFPTSAIAAFGAGGFAFIVWLWRRFRR